MSRKFDHDEARRLYFEEGMRFSDIGKRLGVSRVAIHYACNDKSYEKCKRYGLKPAGECFFCHKSMTYWAIKYHRSKGQTPRCQKCANDIRYNAI